MTELDTKERLLSTAERLFGALGYGETSLRVLTQEAGTNLAAVSYHFGSKKGLFQAVVERLVGPVNEERLRLLDELEATAGDGGPSVEDLLRAFFGPALALGTRNDEHGVRMRKLMGRIRFEGGEGDESVLQAFEEVEARYGPAFVRALPGLSPVGLFWRLHFALGVMCSTMFNPNQLHLLSKGMCSSADARETLDQMVRFVTAGFLAADVSNGSDPTRVPDVEQGANGR